MMVNGKIWPTLTVQPAVYRFRLLNGCNARILSLRIARSNDQTIPMTIIGTEGGLLPLNPVAVNRMVLAPAERFDLICDFRNYAGQTLFMKNNNPPSPVKAPAPSLTTVMRFVVSSGTPSGSVPPAGSLTDPLVNDEVAALKALGPPKLSGGTNPDVGTRMITLNEIGADTPNWKLNLNAHPYEDGSEFTETAEVEHRRGLVLREHHCGHAPDAHPPVLVHRDGPLQLRRQRLRREIRRNQWRTQSQRRSTTGRPHAGAVPEVDPDAPGSDRDGTRRRR